MCQWDKNVTFCLIQKGFYVEKSYNFGKIFDKILKKINKKVLII